MVGEIGIVRLQPAEGNLIPFEKTAELEAGAVPAIAKQDDLSRARLGRNLLQAPDALAGLFVHHLRKFGRRGGDGVIGPGLHLQDPRRLAGSEAGLKLRAEHERNLAEQLAGQARSNLALDAVDELDHFDCALEHDEQSRRFALIDRIFPGIEMNVRSRPRDIRERDRRERGKDRKRGEFVRRQHVLTASLPGAEKCGRVFLGAFAALSSRRQTERRMRASRPRPRSDSDRTN